MSLNDVNFPFFQEAAVILQIFYHDFLTALTISLLVGDAIQLTLLLVLFKLTGIYKNNNNNNNDRLTAFDPGQPG